MRYQKLIANIPEKEHAEIIKFAQEEKRTIGSFTRKALSNYIIKLKKEGKNAI